MDNNVPAADITVENDDADNDIMEPPQRAVYRYSLRSALREARLERDSHRNGYEREFIYICKHQ